MKKRYVYLVLSIIFTLFIFARSLKTADESTGESFLFVKWLSDILRSIITSPPSNLDELVTVFVRKMAHIAEYALHAFLLCGYFSTFAKKIKGNFSWILFLGLFTACTDEAIQLTAEGRAGLISDVFIDFCGTLVGICAYLVIVYLINIKKKKA